MVNRTALVFGATGLVGTALIEELCKSEHYKLIKIFVRADTGFAKREKVQEMVINFDDLKKFADMITGDDLFITIGTTIKKAGSVKRMEEIDRDLPLEIAAIASGNEVEKLAVISSLGADAGSSNYYLRIKGEMESEIMKLKFLTLAILRPSILLGKRDESRLGEATGKIFIRIFGFLLIGRLAKYRGIEAKKVAAAMIKVLNDNTGIAILESDKLQKITA
jgi:uncharacterized protein YbjT (DUF2867 family)